MNPETESLPIRLPVVSGQFYQSDSEGLLKEVNEYIDEAKFFPEYEPIAIIAPHAGYIYSGWIAGYSYRQIKARDIETVVVISPSHTDYFDFSSVMTIGYYRTPLGDIPIDSVLAKSICQKSPSVQESMRGHYNTRGTRGEHALEVQLPFLQAALKNFKIVPIVMGDQSWRNCETLGNILGEALHGKKALIAASSDLSHFHPYKEANRLDSTLIEKLESYKTEDLCKRLNNRELEACGGGPVVAAMIAGKKLGAEGLKVIKHANSGDIPRTSKDSVVGYLAGIIYRSSKLQTENIQNNLSGETDMGFKPLTLEEKKQLMEIAKTTVHCVVKKEKIPDFVPLTETLKEKRGAFVTLTIDGQLRGCIGYIIPFKPLYLTVREVAESAALKDPRFSPVSIRELPELKFEISALSPIRSIDNLDEIVVGRDGIIIKRGYNQGLLLPQVATEYGWGREEFLQHTCLKAGLPKDAWKQPGTEISVFSAEVFDENMLK